MDAFLLICTSYDTQVNNFHGSTGRRERGREMRRLNDVPVETGKGFITIPIQLVSIM